ncbi:hypothetical protein Enr13x_48980 [Stieleria neptunia]|uniref:Chain length determinant protein n=1 Tax=Stieleria neptunia TaxID=2527979 RepID=A0A518HW02_9BACT|nr:hypothetical protein [Stieleria neptunia]QDV45025.1 hypothetical protein Enr13x_48980 [Stieleria neptunia]
MTNVPEPAESERATAQGRTRTTILRRLRWSLPVGILFGLIAGYSVLATVTPRYKASFVLSEHAPEFQAHTSTHSSHLADREKELVLSESVLESVLSDPAIERSPTLSKSELAAETLRQNLLIESGSSSIMVISYIDLDPNAASDVCNLVADRYLARRSELDHRRASVSIELLKPEIERWKTKVEELEQQVLRLAKEQRSAFHSIASGPRHRELQYDRAMHLQQKIDEVEVDLAVLNAVEIEPVSVGASLIDQNDEKAGTKTKGPDELAEANDPSQTADHKHRLEVTHAVLTKRYAEVHRELNAMEGSNVKLQFAQDDLERARALLSKLEDRLAAIRTESKHGPSVVAVSQATPPASPIDDVPTQKAALVAGIGFLIPTLLGCFWPRRKTDARQVDL